MVRADGACKRADAGRLLVIADIDGDEACSDGARTLAHLGRHGTITLCLADVERDNDHLGVAKPVRHAGGKVGQENDLRCGCGGLGEGFCGRRRRGGRRDLRGSRRRVRRPASTPTRTTMSATKAATSATTAITTGRGTRLVVAAMVFTFVVSASGGRSLLPVPGAGANTGREKCLHRDRPQAGCAHDCPSGGTQGQGSAVDRRSRDRHNTRGARVDDDRPAAAGLGNGDRNGGMTPWQGQAKRGVPAQPGSAGGVDRHRSRTGEPTVRIQAFHGHAETGVIPPSNQGEVSSLSDRSSARNDDPSGRAVEEKLVTHRVRPKLVCS